MVVLALFKKTVFSDCTINFLYTQLPVGGGVLNLVKNRTKASVSEVLRRKRSILDTKPKNIRKKNPSNDDADEDAGNNGDLLCLPRVIVAGKFLAEFGHTKDEWLANAAAVRESAEGQAKYALLQSRISVSKVRFA